MFMLYQMGWAKIIYVDYVPWKDPHFTDDKELMVDSSFAEHSLHIVPHGSRLCLDTNIVYHFLWWVI
jgi:hypothetical protein